MDEELIQVAFSQMLLSGTYTHVAPYETIQKKFNVKIKPNVVILVSVDRYPDLAEGKTMEWKIEMGRNLVTKMRASISIPFLSAWTEEGVLALLLDYKELCHSEHKSKMMTLAEEIQSAADEIKINVSIGIGNFYDDPSLIIRSYEEAKKSMSGRFFQGNKLIFHVDQRKEIAEHLKRPLSKETSELFSIVRIGYAEGAVTQIKGIMEKVAETYNYNEEIFKSEVIDLLMMMSRMVLDIGVSPVTILTNTANFIQELYQTIRYDKFVMKVRHYVEWLTGQVEELHVHDVSPIIKEAIHFMKENHQKEISLDDLARNCHLSRFHFSHLFKKEVGQSVMEFFNKLRIDKSLYYLEKTDLTIQEIALKSGFQDSNYYSRLFKKYIKSSPTEYRRLKKVM
ncbi:AraC family transcriptional regulator [Bacillus sp. BRMEA1]|uniref:AraC family transcriptional regulator n=1 Tax=Neobacillus endophyticus TaxID=2738405 RepID=UPI001565EC56|nr:AraC family transcriptional regulator [Neobacillus endophyticus]NRD79783.1 AraC family transcriptional regulator [Neobacillus endophyticus]